jgi:hypothetical protein
LLFLGFALASPRKSANPKPFCTQQKSPRRPGERD